MSFTINRVWMRHESGTKFYQAFRILYHGSNRHRSAQCTVLHYGPTKATRSDHRPVTGGTVIVHPGTSRYYEKVAEKRARGYTYDTHEHIQNDYVHDEGIRVLTHLFGASRRDEILLALGLTAVTGEHVEGDTDPGDDPEDTHIDPFKDRPAAWGSW